MDRKEYERLRQQYMRDAKHKMMQEQLQLPVSSRTGSALFNRRIDSLEKLLEKTEYELSLMKNIGYTKIMEIKTLLAEKGLNLRNSNFAEEYAQSKSRKEE